MNDEMQMAEMSKNIWDIHPSGKCKLNLHSDFILSQSRWPWSEKHMTKMFGVGMGKGST